MCSALLGARWEPRSRRCIWGGLCCALRVMPVQFLWGVVSRVWFNPLEDGACHLTTSRTDKRATKHKRPGAGAAGRSARRVQKNHPPMQSPTHQYLQLYGMPAATSTTAAQICTSTCTACACAVCACQIVTDVHRRMSMLINSCCAERKVRSERAMSHVVPTLLAFKVRTMAREQRGQCHTGTAGADRAVPEPPGTPPAIGQQKGA